MTTIDPRAEQFHKGLAYVDLDGDLWLWRGDQFTYLTDAGDDAHHGGFALSDDSTQPSEIPGHFTELSTVASSALRKLLELPYIDPEGQDMGVSA